MKETRFCISPQAGLRSFQLAVQRRMLRNGIWIEIMELTPESLQAQVNKRFMEDDK